LSGLPGILSTTFLLVQMLLLSACELPAAETNSAETANADSLAGALSSRSWRMKPSSAVTNSPCPSAYPPRCRRQPQFLRHADANYSQTDIGFDDSFVP
jgi:hypothetical protein